MGNRQDGPAAQWGNHQAWTGTTRYEQVRRVNDLIPQLVPDSQCEVASNAWAELRPTRPDRGLKIFLQKSQQQTGFYFKQFDV